MISNTYSESGERPVRAGTRQKMPCGSLIYRPVFLGDFAGWLIEVRKRTIGGTAATPHKKRGYIVRCNPLRFLERETGFEPATFSLGS